MSPVEQTSCAVPVHASRTPRGFARIGALTLCAALAAAGLIASHGARPAAAAFQEAGVGGTLPAALFLRIAGQQVMGDSDYGINRPSGAIDCYSFHHDIAFVSRNGTVNGGPAAKLTVGTVTLRKKVDATSPRIAQSLMAAKADQVEAEFWFYRPNLGSGPGPEQHYYTVKITDARVLRYEQELALCRTPDSSGSPGVLLMPAMETLVLEFDKYECDDEISGNHAEWARTGSTK